MPLWSAIVITVIWALAVLFWRINRIWLPYYITGTVGMAFVLIYFGGQVRPLQEWMQFAVSRSVHGLSAVFQVPTQVFGKEPSAIMILVISQDVGWTMLQVSVESSGLLESSVLASMVLFYPGWSLKKKGWLIAAGLAATFIANIIRLMIITLTVHYLGKDALLISHVVVGRIVFFVLVILIFWMIVTAPTLRAVHNKLTQEARG